MACWEHPRAQTHSACGVSDRDVELASKGYVRFGIGDLPIPDYRPSYLTYHDRMASKRSYERDFLSRCNPMACTQNGDAENGYAAFPSSRRPICCQRDRSHLLSPIQCHPISHNLNRVDPY